MGGCRRTRLALADRLCRAALTDAANPELDRDPRADFLRRLRDRVIVGALARAAHDDEVSVAQGKPSGGGPSCSWPEEKGSGASDREDGDHGVFSGGPADPVAVPGHAVSPVA